MNSLVMHLKNMRHFTLDSINKSAVQISKLLLNDLAVIAHRDIPTRRKLHRQYSFESEDLLELISRFK